MRNTFRILFYIKRSSLLRNGDAPILGRITINGQRVQFSTHLSAPPELWDVKRNCMTGRTDRARRINRELECIRFRLLSCYDRLSRDARLVTPVMVRELYFGAEDRHLTVLEFFRRHNEEFRTMVGVSRSKSTYYKYRSVCLHLEAFIRIKYGRKDLLLKELDREFVTGFHAYVVQELSCRKNTVWIYMIALKHILMLARSKGYIVQDLFANYKLHSEFVSRNYLTAHELSRLMGVTPGTPMLQLVRDAFLFSCFTGLAYSDLRKLRMDHVHREGEQCWIHTTRTKTGAPVHVRLFDLPFAILMKYAARADGGPLFPLPGNGWCNLCLERLMRCAGVDKRITFHAARHTFATTITLSQGVAIETISRLLGHKNIRTTQIYATITHARLHGEMDRLSKRISALCRTWRPLIS